MKNNFGQTVITRGLYTDMENDPQMKKDIAAAWKRYCNHDWGELEEYDKQLNDKAIENIGSDRILAKYKTYKGYIYIITEHDRSYTTFMYCNEY